MLPFAPGDPVPWFQARSICNPTFHFNTVAGRYIVLCLLGSAGNERIRPALDALAAHRHHFDDQQVAFFGVSIDPDDERLGRLRQQLPGVRYFWDFDLAISKLYRACDPRHVPGAGSVSYLPYTLVLDPNLRVLGAFGMEEPAAHVPQVLALLAGLPPIPPSAAAAVQAPVLILPRVFEDEFCRQLVGLYQQHGGQDSGFMRDEAGRTVHVIDYGHKRRADYTIADERVRDAARQRILRRLVPEIKKAYQFTVTRMERYIVACYDADTGGYFRPHRDNTTLGTAHRRFAVSINLNAEEYEGGDLRFPEFGPQTYRAPTGGALVFSCSMLHEVTPITSGSRYTFLPFLYDEEGAKVRQANNRFLAENVQPYQA